MKSVFEQLWRSTHRQWINWFKVPHWLYWLSIRPRRCCACGRWFWGPWYDEFCSRKCNDDEMEAVFGPPRKRD